MSIELEQSIVTTMLNLRASEVYLRSRIKEIIDAFSSFDKQLDDLEALIQVQQQERELRNNILLSGVLSVAERA